MKRCATCKAVKELGDFSRNKAQPDGRQYTCRICRSEKRRQRLLSDPLYAERQRQRRRDYRKNNPELRARHNANRRGTRLAQNAHLKVMRAVRSGAIVPPEHCSQCGVECSPQAHHHDYTRPLDVEWLCVSCHQRRHQGLVA